MLVCASAVREHPRVRGENPYDALATSYYEGTSPRARGKHTLTVRLDIEDRNIPACAGKTKLLRKQAWPAQEHPRVRGENYRTMESGGGRIGTSPRARGKRQYGALAGELQRNIPACAGKTGVTASTSPMK